jgi:xanthosine utilization system XapX-like protein
VLYLFVALVTVGLLIAHTFLESESPRVDTTTLGLLGLLLIVPLAPYITKLRAGELEAQIGLVDAQRLRLQAGELPTGAPQEDHAATQPSDELGVIELTERDPPLGLAKLRMDLERETRRIYQQRLPHPARRGLGLGMMVRELINADVLPREIAAPLQDVLGLANRAVHGEYVQREAAEEIAEIGVRVLEALEGLGDRSESGKKIANDMVGKGLV